MISMYEIDANKIDKRVIIEKKNSPNDNTFTSVCSINSSQISTLTFDGIIHQWNINTKKHIKQLKAH